MRAKRVLGMLCLLIAIAAVPASSPARLNREAGLRYVVIDFFSYGHGYLTVWGGPTENRAFWTDFRIGAPCGDPRAIAVQNLVVARDLSSAMFDIETSGCGLIHAEFAATGPPTVGAYPGYGIQRPATVSGNVPFPIRRAWIGLGVPDPQFLSGRSSRRADG